MPHGNVSCLSCLGWEPPPPPAAKPKQPSPTTLSATAQTPAGNPLIKTPSAGGGGGGALPTMVTLSSVPAVVSGDVGGLVDSSRNPGGISLSIPLDDDEVAPEVEVEEEEEEVVQEVEHHGPPPELLEELQGNVI